MSLMSLTVTGFLVSKIWRRHYALQVSAASTWRRSLISHQQPGDERDPRNVTRDAQTFSPILSALAFIARAWPY